MNGKEAPATRYMVVCVVLRLSIRLMETRGLDTADARLLENLAFNGHLQNQYINMPINVSEQEILKCFG